MLEVEDIWNGWIKKDGLRKQRQSNVIVPTLDTGTLTDFAGSPRFSNLGIKQKIKFLNQH